MGWYRYLVTLNNITKLYISHLSKMHCSPCGTTLLRTKEVSTIYVFVGRYILWITNKCWVVFSGGTQHVKRRRSSIITVKHFHSHLRSKVVFYLSRDITLSFWLGNSDISGHAIVPLVVQWTLSTVIAFWITPSSALEMSSAVSNLLFVSCLNLNQVALKHLSVDRLYVYDNVHFKWSYC